MYHKEKSKSTTESENLLVRKFGLSRLSDPVYGQYCRHVSMSKRDGYHLMTTQKLSLGGILQYGRSVRTTQRRDRILYDKGYIRVYVCRGSGHRCTIIHSHFHREKQILDFLEHKFDCKYHPLYKDKILEFDENNIENAPIFDPKMSPVMSRVVSTPSSLKSPPIKCIKSLKKEVVEKKDHLLSSKEKTATGSTRKTTKCLKKFGNDDIERLCRTMPVEEYERVCGEKLEDSELRELTTKFAKDVVLVKYRNALKLRAQMRRDGYTGEVYSTGLEELINIWCEEDKRQRETSKNNSSEYIADRNRDMIKDLLSNCDSWMKMSIIVATTFVELPILTITSGRIVHSGQSRAVEFSDKDFGTKVYDHLRKTGYHIGKKDRVDTFLESGIRSRSAGCFVRTNP